MVNRQFYTMKFKSSRLKEFGYNIDITFDQAKEYGEMIALADNQFLRSIRTLKNKEVDYIELESWYEERDRLRKKNNSIENSNRTKELQYKINEMMFIPEYITVVIEHNKHYEYMYNNGIFINGKRYTRLSSSAGQARSSTVVFCEEEMNQKLKKVMNNERNEDKELAPSKFNAYFGLAGSATKVVSTPNFCVVPDYFSKNKMMFSYVEETDWEKDDIITVKEVEQNFNRFDGQGLISPTLAAKWAEELGLDYVPSQWCIRQNYIKGMLCVFDVHRYCLEENNGSYLIKSLFKDSEGNDIYIDIKDVDVIISESQFKLWDSFESIEVYKSNCVKNNLKWGVSLYSPKETKNILRMNYQFIQTLNLSKDDIEIVCQKFVDWILGVSSNNIYYTLLFLLGANPTETKIKQYITGSDNYWVKSLILNHSLINDEFIKKKIYEMIKVKIKNACLGEIIVDGNFQTLVSDPYAMMQHVCGKKVTGLLKENEYYSNYWNEKGVTLVDSMRAPLTYRSEHLKLNLKNNMEMRKWYEHCYAGIIVNAFGKETVHWAGSDWDFDQIATTSDKTIINGVFEDELPITYDPPTPKKIHITEDDLYQADLFSFGSAIGSITNKSTTAFSLLPLFKEGSAEYEITMNRLKMCTKLQSAQIDKAKIGRNVKGIPKNWTMYQKSNPDDTEETRDQNSILNNVLLDKHPYFFIYLYGDTKRKYKKYINGKNLECLHRFNMALDDLIDKKRKNEEERTFLKYYYRKLPVIETECVMNNLCKYIESIDFSIKSRLKHSDNNEEVDILGLLKSNRPEWSDDTFKKVLKNIKRYNKKVSDSGNLNNHSSTHNGKYDSEIDTSKNVQSDFLKEIMDDICSNREELVNYLIDLSYCDKPKFKKETLWDLYGDVIFKNIKNKCKDRKVLFPFPSQTGSLDYLNKKYELMEVNI